MAAVTKDRNFFNCPLLLYYKSSRFIQIMQIRHILKEISISSNSSHLEWRAGLSDIIVKGTLPRTIPARFGLIWLRGFRGKDLNVIFRNFFNCPLLL
jgi:metal-responsive CopG/Arc/MetJ family transcriptional regulator